MRVKSTGLGKMELKCEARELSQVDGSFVLKIEAVDPVHWTITATMDPIDLAMMMRMALKPSTTLAVLRALIASRGGTRT